MIKLNDNYSIEKISRNTYYEIEHELNKDVGILVNGRIIKRGRIIRGLKNELIRFKKSHQRFCKALLGAGNRIHFTTPKGAMFEEIPLNWTSYPNYNKPGRFVIGLNNEEQAQNGLSYTKDSVAVVSLNTALQALNMNIDEYAIILLNEKTENHKT
jgi:hypothetical protein